MGTNFNLLKNYFDFLIGSLEMKRMLNLGNRKLFKSMDKWFSMKQFICNWILRLYTESCEREKVWTKPEFWRKIWEFKFTTCGFFLSFRWDGSNINFNYFSNLPSKGILKRAYLRCKCYSLRVHYLDLTYLSCIQLAPSIQELRNKGCL